MTFDEIKARFHDRIRSDQGDNFMCVCPGHDDDRASLSITRGKDGKILIKCFAGCKPAQILSPMGMVVGDLFPTNGTRRNGTHRNGTHRNGTHRNKPTQPSEIVATYDYRDQDDKLIFQVQRRAPKSFIQRRPNGSGGWAYDMNGIVRVLYRLPELVNSDQSDWVLIPEGEKDVDNLWSHNYVATTNAGGANAKWLDSYSESLRGRKVCILPDNDDAGRKHANDVAAHLVRIASDVRILELPGLPEKGDFSDWVEAGNNPTSLLAMIESAPLFSPDDHMGSSAPSINSDTGEVEGFAPSVFDELCAEFNMLDKSNPAAIKGWALDVIDRAATLDGIELGRLKLELEQIKGLARWVDTEFVQLVKQKQKAVKATLGKGSAGPNSDSNKPVCPYLISDGMLSMYSMFGEGREVMPIATFNAWISEEVVGEYGNVVYRVEGKTNRGGSFSTEVDSDTFSSGAKLKAKLEAAVGPLDTVHAKMEPYLGPAIKLLSNPDTIARSKRYDHTGWMGDKFMLPGRTPDGVSLSLPKHLPYMTVEVTDQADGIEALKALMSTLPDEYAPVMLSSVLGPPLARLAELSDRRYGTFIKGQTGTFKTGTALAFMSIYGNGFLDESNILGWGVKATGMSAMHIATSAHDMPYLLDNYKPNTGGGAKAFIELMQAVMEGGERLRMKGKVDELRDAREIRCWPICTGEDMPDTDTATTARFLIIPMARRDLPAGLKDHKLQKKLVQIGSMWIDWLETQEGRDVADEVLDAANTMRDKWAAILLSTNSKMPNHVRVATTLALNQAFFFAATLHPVFGDVLKPYINSHVTGLKRIAHQMANAASDSQEAERMMSAVRELLSTGACTLANSTQAMDNMVMADRENIVGWRDGDGGAYLFPNIARGKAERLIGDKLSAMSLNGIGNQLKELGWLASHNPEESTKTKRVGAVTQKVWHVNAKALGNNQMGQQDLA